MSKDQELKRVFTGSAVEAEFVKGILEDNGIGALIRNTMRESLVAGWISGAQTDSCLVYVAKNHKEKAEELIQNASNSKENPNI